MYGAHMDTPTPVLTRDRSSGRIHLRIKMNGHLYSQEGCNLDAAGDFDEVTEMELASAQPGQLCKRDFPDLATP